MKDVATLLASVSFIVLVGLLTWNFALTPLWNTFIVKYDKPWWSGTQYHRVCDAFDSSKCYTLPVTSNGDKITQISFGNGGYLTPTNSICAKAAKSDMNVDRFCSITDQTGKEWDILPN